MGGVDSMRGWNLNSFIPQDDVDRIFTDKDKPDYRRRPDDPGQQVPNPNKFTANTKPIRGGDLMINERVELRIPIRGPFETVVFGDFGNLWIDPDLPVPQGRLPDPRGRRQRHPRADAGRPARRRLRLQRDARGVRGRRRDQLRDRTLLRGLSPDRVSTVRRRYAPADRR